MRILPSVKKRLELLNAAQPDRPWKALRDQRRCIACERIFRGEEVEIRWSRSGVVRLACPNCASLPALWVRPGNPLLDGAAWAEWDQAMDALHAAEPNAFA